jgi:hypothetical protein
MSIRVDAAHPLSNTVHNMIERQLTPWTRIKLLGLAGFGVFFGWMSAFGGVADYPKPYQMVMIGGARQQVNPILWYLAAAPLPLSVMSFAVGFVAQYIARHERNVDRLLWPFSRWGTQAAVFSRLERTMLWLAVPMACLVVYRIVRALQGWPH